MSRPVRRAAALAAVLAVLAAVPAGPMLALTPTDCRVRNLESGVVKRSLQAAVIAATAGDHLTVRGVCTGITVVGKILTITGIRPSGAAKPRLDANGAGTTVTTAAGKSVRIRSLTITGGDGFASGATVADNGGGVVNRGRLALTDVIVRGNVAHCGGGISAQAPLILAGSTAIHHNFATLCGGGIDVDGSFRSVSLLMKGTSAVRDNESEDYGGGVNVWGNDSPASLTMEGSSSIHGNIAAFQGGGVNNQGGTLSGFDCASPGPRVHDNTPTDCVNES